MPAAISPTSLQSLVLCTVCACVIVGPGRLRTRPTLLLLLGLLLALLLLRRPRGRHRSARVEPAVGELLFVGRLQGKGKRVDELLQRGR